MLHRCSDTTRRGRSMSLTYWIRTSWMLFNVVTEYIWGLNASHINIYGYLWMASEVLSPPCVNFEIIWIYTDWHIFPLPSPPLRGWMTSMPPSNPMSFIHYFCNNIKVKRLSIKIVSYVKNMYCKIVSVFTTYLENGVTWCWREPTGVEITKRFSLSFGKVSKILTCPPLTMPVRDIWTPSI